jgi:hypothetical protein
MSPVARAIFERSIAELAKVNIIVKALTNNDLVVSFEPIIPNLVQVVAELRMVEGLADKLIAAAPLIEGTVDVLTSFAQMHPPRPADGDELAALSADRERGG